MSRRPSRLSPPHTPSRVARSRHRIHNVSKPAFSPTHHEREAEMKEERWIMSAHAVSLTETDRLESLVVPFIPSPHAGSEIATLPLAEVGPADMVYDGIVGRSRALRDLVDHIKLVAPTESTVLICGETGTGKELVARAVHDLRARRSHAFVKCHCAAIPTGLLESELFGHEKGSFTGAVAQRIGRFELANHG